MSKSEELMENLKSFYLSAINQTDPRTRDYPLVWNDPTAVLSLVSVYILFVTFGKKVMEKLPAVNVPSWVLFVYNFSLVLLSLYMFEEIVVGVYNSKYNMACAEITNEPKEAIITNALYCYFFSKAVEFLDTFWMIIRKRFTQVTFLHVFHHSSMLIIWWFIISWVPGGQAWFSAALNSAVHVIMYLYYALSIFPSLKEYLWWKKYITLFQLLQFVSILIHTITGLYLSETGQCNYPKWPQYLLVCYMIIMLLLFSNFYRQEYIKKTNEKKKRRERDENNNLIKNSNGKKAN